MSHTHDEQLIGVAVHIRPATSRSSACRPSFLAVPTTVRPAETARASR
ncbi:hypothetical protein [Austwickia chelonae]|nr:hypothetical protein [Austwickia chelonae]